MKTIWDEIKMTQELRRQRVQHCIELMENAKINDNLYMQFFQSKWDNTQAESIADNNESLHSCGNKACFAGHLAISEYFQKSGGTINHYGMPVYDGFEGHHAVARWLMISFSHAKQFVLADEGTGGNQISTFYNELWKDVTPDHVIEKLKELL